MSLKGGGNAVEDALSSETTSLLGTRNDALNADVDESDNASDDTRLWEELEKPWPSTYERSIALLASPMIQKAQADLFTKSPKPGSTPAALARRRDLRRGFYTPEATKIYRPINLSNRGDDDFRMEIEKVKSMDFKSQKQMLLQTHQKQKLKAVEAQKYREMILKMKDEEGGQKSPGYLKEATIRSQRRKRDEMELMMIDGKSSVAQCVFNLANILMGVGLLGLPYALKCAGWIGGLGSLLIFGFITWRTSILIGRELNGDPRPSHAFDDSPFKSPLPPGSVRHLPPRIMPQHAAYRTPFVSHDTLRSQRLGSSLRYDLSLTLRGQLSVNPDVLFSPSFCTLSFSLVFAYSSLLLEITCISSFLIFLLQRMSSSWAEYPWSQR